MTERERERIRYWDYVMSGKRGEIWEDLEGGIRVSSIKIHFIKYSIN